MASGCRRQTTCSLAESRAPPCLMTVTSVKAGGGLAVLAGELLAGAWPGVDVIAAADAYDCGVRLTCWSIGLVFPLFLLLVVCIHTSSGVGCTGAGSHQAGLG